METTDKLSCNILADLLAAHGVKRIVVSPGSRNAPIIVALSRRENLICDVVIDERSAAFVALGIAVQSGKPTAIVCTSGTALLNYAPAVAEAFYRGVPLIVVSADRPEEWIDQDDSQTLWQPGVLDKIVKRTWDIPARIDCQDARWSVNRMINDALIEATTGRRGPVHLNIRLDAPLSRMTDYSPGSARVINMVKPVTELSTREARELGAKIGSPRRVMVIAGFHEPDERLTRALAKMAALPNVVVLTETIANLHSPLFISRIDTTLSAMSDDEKREMRPDVVITVGGALVSRHIKEYVRSLPGVEHWSVGENHATVDCFRYLSLRVDMPATVFMRQIASAMQPFREKCDYSERWHEIYRRAIARHDGYVANAPWSDMAAMSHIIKSIPRGWNLHLSNGTPVRYAQLMDCTGIHRSDCNRGVSGIDGCTSTALGASTVYNGITLLITGDMSCQYDLAALSSALMSPRMKIIVMCNGGGGIFRFIGSTSSLPELDRFFAGPVNLPLQQIADGYGMAYFEAYSIESLESSFKRFAAETKRAALLAVRTPAEVSAKVLKEYFTH